MGGEEEGGRITEWQQTKCPNGGGGCPQGTVSAIGPPKFFSLLKKHGTTKEGKLY